MIAMQRLWFQVVITIVGVATTAAAAQIENDDSSPATLKIIHRRIAAQDFDGALKRLAQLNEGDLAVSAGEIRRLEALCYLGNALLADNAGDEALSALVLVGRLQTAFPKIRDQFPDHPFVLQIGQTIDDQGREAVKHLESWQRLFRRSLEDSRRASEAALEAYELTLSAGNSPDEVARLLAWSRLLEYLIQRDAVQMLARLRAHQAVQSILAAEPKSGPAEGLDKGAAEARLRSTLSDLIAIATKSEKADLPLAIADCLTLYCAAAGRLKSEAFIPSWIKYTNLPTRELAPPPGKEFRPVPPPTDPAAALGEDIVSVTMSGAPESLLLPLYQLAVSLDRGHRVPAAHYSYYLVLLRLNEEAAGQLLRDSLPYHRRDAAFLLEQARFALRYERNARSALATLIDAIGSGGLQRPVFASLPSELQAPWSASRHQRVLTPEFALTYRLFFHLIDLQAAEAIKFEAASPQYLSLRLRLAELLIGSNLAADCLYGLTEAYKTLQRLSGYQLPEEQAAQVLVYKQRIQEAMARMPRVPAALLVNERGIQTYYEPTQHFVQDHGPSFFVVFPTSVEFGLSDPQRQ